MSVLFDESNNAGIGFIENFEARYPLEILKQLLKDRTTGNNIIWADDEYEELGEGYQAEDEITIDKIIGVNSGVIKPRIAKEQEKQSQRTKSHAEVFTPSWLCNKMNNDIDEIWFKKRNVFNNEEDKNWEPTTSRIVFPKIKGHGWHAYVESSRLEITCGEAPYVCSRYDTVTGHQLEINERIGILDRKLRVVTERTNSVESWIKWAYAALKSCFGYEYQGDNLVIARVNVFETVNEHFANRWNEEIQNDELFEIADIITWNFWQMDGLSGSIPRKGVSATEQLALFEIKEIKKKPSTASMFDTEDFLQIDTNLNNGKSGTAINKPKPCMLMDWSENKTFEFNNLRKGNGTMGKKFYAVIGNPPYQIESRGENNSDTPIYHHFYDTAYSVADKVELISPARFLFNAGGTPSEWNKKMLEDENTEVMSYKPKSNCVFANTDIKGGVAILYRDSQKKIGPIGTFTQYKELTSIVEKVKEIGEKSLCEIITNRGIYRYSSLAYANEPETMKKASDARIAPSSFERMPNLFTATMPKDNHEYVEILGREKNNRAFRWFRKDYIKENSNLEKYKVIVPKANGSGALGETLSTPLIGKPLIGFTETYISIGEVDSLDEAEAILKYIKGKFARSMLGVLKVTQNNAKPVWKYVPLQDFTSNSDIDWSQSVADIDKQLYKKYGLNDEEIEFIEAHVKEME